MRLSFRKVSDTVTPALRRIGSGLLDFTPAWNATLAEIEKAVESSFERGAFAPLSPRYAARKAHRFPGRPILVATGALKGSLTNDHAPGALRRIRRFGFEYGSAISVGSYNLLDLHRQGTPRMPVRDPIPSERELNRLTREQIMKHLQRLFTGRP